jgi:hypothetical protein
MAFVDRGHRLMLMDSAEMLNQLPKEPFIEKHAGRFPDQRTGMTEPHREKVDVIICYSVRYWRSHLGRRSIYFCSAV